MQTKNEQQLADHQNHQNKSHTEEIMNGLFTTMNAFLREINRYFEKTNKELVKDDDMNNHLTKHDTNSQLHTNDNIHSNQFSSRQFGWRSTHLKTLHVTDCMEFEKTSLKW